ncbi:hypothetical protein CBS101457_000263 [Exobasidium rhododendri]|nr:hypothetical protein CBS101457_000263 [Exobasidium rhododendri]
MPEADHIDNSFRSGEAQRSMISLSNAQLHLLRTKHETDTWSTMKDDSTLCEAVYNYESEFFQEGNLDPLELAGLPTRNMYDR